LQGFCQWIGERAFIIRIGDATERMWHDWTKTLTATIEDDGHVMFWAWAGKGDRKLVEAFVRQANIETRLPVEWLRKSEPDPILMRQISGINGGKIIMARQPNSKNPIHKELPDPSTVSDPAEHQKHVAHALDLAAKGKIKFSQYKETYVDDKTDILSVKRTTV
jgi:hypothetical protein